MYITVHLQKIVPPNYVNKGIQKALSQDCDITKELNLPFSDIYLVCKAYPCRRCASF